MSPILTLLEVLVTTGAIRSTKLQSNRHHQRTNTNLLVLVHWFIYWRFISSSKNTDDCRKLINSNTSQKRRERTVVWLWSRLVCRAPTASVDYPWWYSPSVSSLPPPSSPPPAMCQFIVVASGKSSSTLFLQPLLILLLSVSLRPLKNSALKSAEILLWGTLVVWLVFNCIFSTNRLYHAIGVWNISCSAGDKTNTS